MGTAHPRPSAHQRCLEFLRGAIARQQAAGETRLPSHEELAMAAGVSPLTALRAIRTLVAEGVLTSRPGTGITIGANNTGGGEPLTRAAPRLKWQRIAAHIEGEISAGLTAPGGTLAPHKVLEHRYGANHRTVRKALVHLCGNGVIDVYARGYRARDLSSRSRANTVLLLCAGDPRGAMQSITPRTRDILRYLEEACRQSEVTLVSFPYDIGRSPQPSGFPHAARLWEKQPVHDSSIGAIILTARADPAHLASAVAWLTSCGKPSVLLDETGVMARNPSLARSHLSAILPMSYTQTAARHVGRYLSQGGHRHVAYVSPQEGRPWSDNRLAGLCAVLRDPGVGGEVLACQTPPRANPDTDPAVAERARVSLGRILGGELGGRAPGATSVSRLWTSFASALEVESQWDALEPLFERAASHRDITAWVCASDSVALMAREFLARHGRSVPGELSLVGFDDTIEAFTFGLTSYNFSTRACAMALLRQVLQPDHRAIRTRGALPEIEGFVIERSSSRPISGRRAP